MKLIKTINSAGHVLCHDMTMIVKDVSKGPRFRKGHVVAPEDIPVLLSMGKENLYVYECNAGYVHEDEGAKALAALCVSDGLSSSPDIREGKMEITADFDGVFVADEKRIRRINSIGQIIIATRHTNMPVKAGDKVCGMRVIPLVIKKTRLDSAAKVCGQIPLLSLHPYVKRRAGIVVTGSEVFCGRIADTFSPVVEEKLKQYGIDTVEKMVVDDGKANICAGITALKEKGVDIILCTGGMSVDPDDNTPGAIRASGAKTVVYGAPVLPGAMVMLAYFADGTPVVGLPGCVMYAKTTIFDIILPRLAADVRLAKKDFTSLGVGGFCLGCTECTYPICGFGKEGGQ